MSGPNLSKDPSDGPDQPSNPYSPSAQDAGPAEQPAYDAPQPGTSSDSASYQSAPYESAGYQSAGYQGAGYQGAAYQGQYPGGPGYPYTPPPATNTMALASLIASIAGWTVVPFIGCVVGVVLGHIARGQLRQSNEQGAGLALAGLITGYVGLGLAALALIGFVLLAVVFGVGSATW